MACEFCAREKKWDTVKVNWREKIFPPRVCRDLEICKPPKDFIQGHTKNSICIQGPVGSGKTIFAAMLLEDMKKKLEAEAAHIEMSFAYFMNGKQQGPGTLNSSRYECCMHGSLEKEDDLEFRFVVPVSLPTSEKNGQGLPRSHGHWGRAVTAVKFNNFIWIEDLITLVETAIDQELNMVPRPNENSMSVESLTRRVAKCLGAEEAIKEFSLRIENLAQGYSTFAVIDSSS
jgi:GTP cyclohydrolase I